VVDEFGGTAGMLTMEDVVETIVGDIEDEHDTPQEVEERLGPDEFLFSARIEVHTPSRRASPWPLRKARNTTHWQVG
jgi:CBS domain containing-hemolysin-like protein